MKGPKLKRDWIGLRVRLLRKARNGYGRLPAGITGVIDSQSCGRQGLGFHADRCKHCGAGLSISGMKQSDFDVLTPKEEWPNSEGKGRSYYPVRPDS